MNKQFLSIVYLLVFCFTTSYSENRIFGHSVIFLNIDEEKIMDTCSNLIEPLREVYDDLTKKATIGAVALGTTMFTHYILTDYVWPFRFESTDRFIGKNLKRFSSLALSTGVTALAAKIILR